MSKGSPLCRPSGGKGSLPGANSGWEMANVLDRLRRDRRDGWEVSDPLGRPWASQLKGGDVTVAEVDAYYTGDDLVCKS